MKSAALPLVLALVAASGGGPREGRWRGQALGVCWEGSPRPIDAHEVEALVPLSVNAVSQTPFGFMRDPRKPELGFELELEGRGWWGEHAEGVRFLARAARERGIATLLKPHLWLHGSWPGEIEMTSEADWATWFANYREFLLAWARFAAEEELEGLCLGTELDKTALRADEWRALIVEVRAIYPGLLTYAANWDRFETIPFWEELDAIGVNAYFPLSVSARPTSAEMGSAWKPIAARLEALAERTGRPIVFTEIGYHPVEGACREPWVWNPEGAARAPEVQAAAYEAVARTFFDEPWFGGIFWWKWHASGAREGRRGERATFSPQGLPAEEVLARTFRAAREP
jgi:hypothetical protein